VQKQPSTPATRQKNKTKAKVSFEAPPEHEELVAITPKAPARTARKTVKKRANKFDAAAKGLSPQSA